MTSGLPRRIALQLHGLAPPDRRWALAQLPSTLRKDVESLLRELRAMGVPADLAQAVAERGAAPWVSPEFGELRAAIERLSPSWAARLLAAARSPDTPAVVQSSPADRASALQHELSRHSALPPGLEAFFRQVISESRALTTEARP